ncbi:MAG TPA: hypothetical protein DCE11_08820 [Ruminiclostridium sp.]|nr:hypothetical protein [Ruminiclostridium sp.]
MVACKDSKEILGAKMVRLMKDKSILLIVILLVPVAIAIVNGFEPMKGTVTYSWGNTVITREVKSLTVNPPLALFLGALVFGLYRTRLAFGVAPLITFLYTFLTLWLVWSGVRGELYGVLFYAVMFALIGLIGAAIAFFIYSLFLRIFIEKSKSDM